MLFDDDNPQLLRTAANCAVTDLVILSLLVDRELRDRATHLLSSVLPRLEAGVFDRQFEPDYRDQLKRALRDRLRHIDDLTEILGDD